MDEELFLFLMIFFSFSRAVLFAHMTPWASFTEKIVTKVSRFFNFQFSLFFFNKTMTAVWDKKNIHEKHQNSKEFRTFSVLDGSLRKFFSIFLYQWKLLEILLFKLLKPCRFLYVLNLLWSETLHSFLWTNVYFNVLEFFFSFLLFYTIMLRKFWIF